MKAPKKSSTLFARVDHRMKADFRDACREVGVDESALLRALAAATIALPPAARTAFLRYLLRQDG